MPVFNHSPVENKYYGVEIRTWQFLEVRTVAAMSSGGVDVSSTESQEVVSSVLSFINRLLLMKFLQKGSQFILFIRFCRYTISQIEILT